MLFAAPIWHFCRLPAYYIKRVGAAGATPAHFCFSPGLVFLAYPAAFFAPVNGPAMMLPSARTFFDYK